MANGFTREIYLETISKTVKLYQQEVGDVGCVVWDAAIVLSKYLEFASYKKQLNLRGKNVLELGAGVGCVGLTSSCLGAYVTMTDLPELLPLLKKNILDNEVLWQDCCGKAEAKPLKWRNNLEVEEWFHPDFLVMADCVYYAESTDDLLATMINLCSESTEVIICQEERDTEIQRKVWNTFLESFGRVFHYHKVSENDQHHLFHSPDIVILRAKKK